ncbi:pyruvate kinase [uncultured Corynebacterium sp.]|uniref:pyruvate kinase n=1 Tax=uncultured Corynebacterium sp. TaxID=159447 RepID=UPI0025CF8C7B|nr:pyruvate kinase [uncultured Corynebacterium sp.]
MQHDVRPLIEQLDDLLSRFDRVSADSADLLAAVHPEHRAGAENLLQYAHLRTIDIRELQNRLHDLGVTSLTTAESGVYGRLAIARAVLRAVAGLESDTDVAGYIELDDAADVALDEHSDRLFGVEREGVPARIMVTLPSEAADDPELVRGFARAGMDVARINCAHDGQAAWLKMIDNVRTAAAEVGRDIEVSMDLAGPKIRTGAVADGPRVGRARVTRDDAGTVLTPAKLWLTPRVVDLGGPGGPGEPDEAREGHVPPRPAPVPEGLPGRPALPLTVDAGWLENLQVGAEITLHDNRSAKRQFTVTHVEDGGVLAEGDRNAYVADGTLLRHDYEKTRATGVPPVVRKLRFEVGDEMVLTTEDVESIPFEESGEPPRVSCTLPEAVAALEVGQPVLFDDGAIAAEVVDVAEVAAGEVGAGEDDDSARHEARLKVTRAKPGGQNLAAHKGINLPTTDLPVPALTDEDVENLRFVAEHGHVAAVSFIRTPADVEHVLEVLESIAAEHEAAGEAELAERTRGLGVVLKIETIPAFENLPAVLVAGMRHANMGIMIARGDLAVELGFQRMGEVPGQILALAQAARVPTILGTQVLESLAKSGLPARAEITDAAFALRAECVMLNKGPHVTDAIGILDDLATKMGRSQRKSRIMLRRIRSWGGDSR